MNRTIPAYLLAVLLFALPAHAGFQHAELDLPGKILEVLTADIDGQGAPEVLVLYRQGLEPDESIFLQLYSYENAEFQPLKKLSPPEGAAFFDIADVDADGAEEIVYITPGTIIAQEPDGGSLRSIVDIDTFALAPDPQHLPYQDFARDWTGENVTSMLVPGRGDMVLLKPDPNGEYRQVSSMDIEIRAYNDSQGQAVHGWAWNSYVSNVTIPSIMLEDVDADGLRDLCFAYTDQVWVHRARKGPEGVSFSKAPDIQKRFEIRNDQELQLGNMAVITVLTQIDEDGKADAAVLKYGGGLRDMRSRLEVHLGNGSGFSEEPDYALDYEGVAPNPRIADLNLDGGADLILPYTKIGVFELIQVLTTGAVDVDYNIYLYNGNGLYPQEPDLTPTAKYLVDYRIGISLVGITPDFSGDFNSDGRPDLLYGLDKHRAAVSLGVDDDKLFGKPAEIFEIEPTLAVIVKELNGDDADDLIFFYPFNPDLDKKVILLINDKNW